MLGADYHATLDGKEAGEAINKVIERGKAAEHCQNEVYAGMMDRAEGPHGCKSGNEGDVGEDESAQTPPEIQNALDTRKLSPLHTSVSASQLRSGV